MKSFSGVGAFSKKMMYVQNNVTQQIFEERKKAMASKGLIQKFGTANTTRMV